MLTLSREELAALTGRTQPAAQIRWLSAHGWVYDVGSDGLPKVARAYFERRMVFGTTPLPSPDQSAGAPVWQVNVEALRSVSPKS